MSNTTLIKKLPPISDKRCQNENDYGDKCNKWLMIIDDKETCIVCDTEIGKETKRLEKEMKDFSLLKEKFKCLDVFKNESLVNERLKNATFANYAPTSDTLTEAKSLMMRYVRNYSDDNPVPLILMGSYGTGKSHLAYAAVKEISEKQKTSIFISVPRLLTKIKGSYNDSEQPSELKILEALESVNCLVLDDIGAEQTKVNKSGDVPWSTQKLFEIIDSRIGKHTIFTTNLDYQQLRSHLGQRNFSRLMEGVHVIKMNGDDYRLKRFKDDLL